MLDKERRHIDAVTVSTPDHNHAIQALAAMQLGKHVYVQKPLAHDVWEVRVLADAAKRYKVVTQMGNQDTSNDGPRQIREWYEAGLIGDVHTVYCWTGRPFWPHRSSNFRPVYKTANPKELDWDLWLGTAPTRDYLSNVAPVIGGTGGTTVQGHSATWDATCSKSPSVYWAYSMCRMSTPPWARCTLRSGRKEILGITFRPPRTSR